MRDAEVRNQFRETIQGIKENSHRPGLGKGTSEETRPRLGRSRLNNLRSTLRCDVLRTFDLHSRLLSLFIDLVNKYQSRAYLCLKYEAISL